MSTFTFNFENFFKELTILYRNKHKFNFETFQDFYSIHLKTKKITDLYLKTIKIYFCNSNIQELQNLTSIFIFVNLLQSITIKILKLWFPFWFNENINLPMSECDNLDFHVSFMLEKNLLIQIKNN